MALPIDVIARTGNHPSMSPEPRTGDVPRTQLRHGRIINQHRLLLDIHSKSIVSEYYLLLSLFQSCLSIPYIYTMSKNSHPDADLHPEATGLAKKTVDKHSDEQPLKLYAGWLYGQHRQDGTKPCSNNDSAVRLLAVPGPS